MINQKIALIGSPNVGKTTLFNQLTGLQQKTGNYPGITVEKKSGTTTHNKTSYTIIDLPGLYSIFPNSKDEEVASSIIKNNNHPDHPDFALVVSDTSAINKSILLYQQVRALGLDAFFVLNVQSEKEKNKALKIQGQLEEFLQSKVCIVNVKSNKDVQDLKINFSKAIPKFSDQFTIPPEYKTAVESYQNHHQINNWYTAWYELANTDTNQTNNPFVQDLFKQHNIIPKRLRVKETIQRNQILDKNLPNNTLNTLKASTLNNQLDTILTHPILGYVIFFAIIMLIFQAIFTWAEKPMDWIETAVLYFAESLAGIIPKGPVNQIITEGILPGIAGIIVFVPQIAILFFFISLMEASGYMSRVVFLMDRWMKPFGLNGKSVVPFISGVACAIPAIMSARNIENSKERLITILVTPFMTCSARLPIYTIIIAMVIPNKSWGIFNLKGITLFALYALGVIAALLVAWLLKKVLKSTYKSYLILEMPTYKIPSIKDVITNVLNKTWSFIWGAGRVILAVSIILWVMGSFGFNNEFNNAQQIVNTQIKKNGFNAQQQNQINLYTQQNPNKTKLQAQEVVINNQIQAVQLENSLLGQMGKIIEPIVQPLGFDWKIGIGLISSFAAREVFVGTMATIYSLGATEDESTIQQRMAAELNPKTGKPVYNIYTGLSLLVFYAFAMQCMSTLAIVKQETNSWKWPVIQTIFMTGMAYISALLIYQILS